MSIPDNFKTKIGSPGCACSGCHEPCLYGSRPDHKSGCIQAAGKWADDDCPNCGHWNGLHTNPTGAHHGCILLGCDCSLDAKPRASIAPKKCECGASSLGYGPGLAHSHFSSRDKAKWCPLRVET